MRPCMLLTWYSVIVILPLALVTHAGVFQAGMPRAAAIVVGAAALAVLLLQFLSSGRYDLFSGNAGIDRTMRFHQLAGRAVLVLALVHPVPFLMPRSFSDFAALPSQAAYLFTAPHLLSGTLALLLLVLLVPMGVLRNRTPIRYEVWRATHAIAALTAAAAAIHHVSSVGAYSAAPGLAAYWWMMVAVAFGTWGYLYVVKPFLLARHPYRIVENREIGARIREVVLRPECGEALEFQAGQFGWVLLDQPPITLLDHPFSFSSAPAQRPELRLLIKSRGDFTGNLHKLAPGARAYIDGPHGNFTLRGRSGETIALIAGGIGIAPIMSLLRQLRAEHDQRPVGLVYGARNTRQLVHAAEVRETAHELDLEFRFFVDEPEPGWGGGVGEITRESVRRAVRGAPGKCVCFVCGPTPMMLACREHALACGVPDEQIVLERFDYD
jgi:predicted ferric reductase